jgi:hypothetical protein
MEEQLSDEEEGQIGDIKIEAEVVEVNERFHNLITSVDAQHAELLSIAPRRAEALESLQELVDEIARMDELAANIRELRTRECLMLDGLSCPRGRTGACWSECEDSWCAVCVFVGHQSADESDGR